MEHLIHDPLTRLIAQIMSIVLASRALGVVARRLGQPMVIAEVVAGILLGPTLLGWLAPEVSGAIFAKESMGSLQLVSQLGLVLFMFLIGLEFDPKLMVGRGKASLVISYSSIVLPFALGALLSLYLYPILSDPSVPFPAFFLFSGVAMSITAFPVLARILSEKRLLRTRVGAMAIACAAIDDVTAWCLLAFIVAIARADGLSGAAITLALALGYIALMMLAIRPLLGRLSATVASRAGLTQGVVAGVILLLFASSWITELIGIHALFGAFLFGAVMPKEGGLAHALAEKLEDFVLVVLLPLFFAYSGVRTQIGLLESGEDWLDCALITLLACVGKFGGSALAARFMGTPWREASALGVLMNTRGLMELIVLNIGLDIGVIGPKLFAMMVIMALFTTFMTSPILQLIYPPSRIAKDLLEPEPAPEPAPAGEPFPVLICVAYAGSGPGLLALADALQEPRDPLYALHLVPPTDRASFYLEQGEPEPDSGGLKPLLERARELERDVKALSFVSAEPAEDICNVARMKGADLVLMGWHKPVLSQALLGGPVYRVMQSAPGDVAVFVDHGLKQPKRVLVPFAGTGHDAAALALAARLQRREGASVTLLHVRRPGDEPMTLPDAPEVAAQVVEGEDPIAVVLRESRGYDLVIVGVGRTWGLTQRMVGVNSERLMRETPTSLLIVRGQPSGGSAASPEDQAGDPPRAVIS